MKKRRILAAMLLLLVVLTAGCGEAKSEVTTPITSLTLAKDGSISYRLAETFEKSYYNLSELEQMAREEAKEFNEKNPRDNGSAVVVERVEAYSVEGAEMPQVIADVDSDTTAVITYSFLDDNAFRKFTGENIYFGTIQNAIENKSVSFLGKLTAVNGRNSISELELNQYKKEMIFSTAGKDIIYTDMKPVFASDGVIFEEDGRIDLSNVEGTAIIIFK